MTSKRLFFGLRLLAAAGVIGAAVTGCTLLGVFDTVEIRYSGQVVTSHDFGVRETGSAGVSAEFTIVNTGSFPLDMSGTSVLSVSGTDVSAFSLGALSATTLDGSGSATFTVTFAPGSGGTKTATVTLNAGKGAQSFTVSGYGGMGVLALTDQSSNPVAAGATVDEGVTNVPWDYYFTITNTSTLHDITLDPAPITVDPPDDIFSVDTPAPGSPVAAGGGTTNFYILFNPGSDTSPHSATVTVHNSATGTFSFIITATGSGMGT